MSNILITGGAGFIGSNLCEYFLGRGEHVTCLDNFATGHMENLIPLISAYPDTFRLIVGDIRNMADCRRAVDGADYVLHEAALGSVPRSINDPVTTNDVNIGGFLNMLVAARDAGVKRFVFAASSSTYGDSKSLPKVEDVIGKPLSPYAITKYVDELYADVLLWTEKGWVDYMLPQLYWTLEKKVASSEKLAYWWNDNANGRHMYIGQSIGVTMDTPDLAPSKNPTQLDHKIRLSRELPNIQGNCWWPGYMITSNYKGIADSLAVNQQSTVALVPSYPWIDSVAPDEVSGLRAEGRVIKWQAPETDDVMQQARAYVVYCFGKDEEADLENASSIVCVTYSPEYVIPDDKDGEYRYVVTVLDRANNESKEGKSVVVEL